MNDWNVVVTINGRCLREARRLLQFFGPVNRTDFFNVLVLKTENIPAMLEHLRKLLLEDPLQMSCISRVVPVTHTFSFQSAVEFEDNSKELVLSWVPSLYGKSFHVRIHRRGFKGRFNSPEEEKMLDAVLLEALERDGSPGRITFEDPDGIIAVETVSNRAGLSFWSREDMSRYSFIRPD